ncbi:bifunctional metallophosphatase/5'-nucleotidase [Marininema halotolerans]|uniref:2',3'-cyclic-nucleotide 2'-phosphodiesterase/5'-or 3'-nucleotidase, 5'-nucleotidase family n=1 Tax=Marininema halotolerans TaxID=1155944 RepID=A0A1I6RIK6_9BACL|nr:bifunctional UDP-sugar hydrolase/5'-nucleotidase [Marininema halotolerans]SFS64476.1 2',3'-cyclic-nucleotide 2'-phosphodiesterase/5'-or 3'-nucleotidase, 5'-nucleotidase family [Marininema halotolerans]
MHQRIRVHLLHTNDIHSHFDKMPHMYTAISTLRKELHRSNEPCFTVDVGDHMDRVRIETEGSHGLANRDIMCATGYQLVTLGNNELLTFSKDELRELYQDAPFTVLATNVKEKEGGTPSWARDIVIQEIDGCRIAFLGVTISFPTVYELLGWNVEDPFDVLATEVAKVRGKVDGIVLLSHLGLGNDRRLAERIPGIDVILGGHTHHLLRTPEWVGSTMIAAAGQFGEYLGHVTMELDKGTRRISKMTAKCVPVEEFLPDQGMEKDILYFRQKAQAALAEPLLTLTDPLPIHWNDESPLGNLLADGLLAWMDDADCAMVNAGQLLDGLERGGVSRARLHEICPHPINPCRMILTGERIRLTLEQAVVKEFQNRRIKGFGFRGKQLGTINMAGIEAIYDGSRPPMERLRSVMINGFPLEDDRQYQVATIDMFTFGVGYLEMQKGEPIQYCLPEFLRDVLAHQLQQPGAIQNAWKRRWHPIV